MDLEERVLELERQVKLLINMTMIHSSLFKVLATGEVPKNE